MILYIEIPDKLEDLNTLKNLLTKYDIRSKVSGISGDIVHKWIIVQGMSYEISAEQPPEVQSKSSPLYTVISKNIFKSCINLIEEWFSIFRSSYFEIKDILAGSFNLDVKLKSKDINNYILDVVLRGFDGECIIRNRSKLTKNGLGQFSIKQL